LNGSLLKDRKDSQSSEEHGRDEVKTRFKWIGQLEVHGKALNADVKTFYGYFYIKINDGLKKALLKATFPVHTSHRPAFQFQKLSQNFRLSHVTCQRRAGVYFHNNLRNFLIFQQSFVSPWACCGSSSGDIGMRLNYLISFSLSPIAPDGF
jgi:hypothetical protein